ncbi:MAG: hypothetical protein IAF38_00725, partial [Bacteroidia bacterium]|nr:hypothetical protein [Bacteroidia bacterium]
LTFQNWGKRYGILVEDEKFILKKTVDKALYSLKDKRLMVQIKEKEEALKKVMPHQEIEALLLELKYLYVVRERVNKLQGRTIIK